MRTQLVIQNSITQTCITAIVIAVCAAANAQNEDAPTPEEAPTPEVVSIDYPDQLPLDALADYVSQTLGVHILYTDELKGQHVVVRPGRLEIAKDRLLDLLHAVLAARGLALVPDSLPGLYRVTPLVDAQRLADEIRTQPPGADLTAGRIVTQVIAAPSGNTKQLAARLQAFTSSGKASLIEVPERGTIIITDYEAVVARILRLVELMDAPAQPMTTESIAVQQPDVAPLCQQIESILAAEAVAEAGPVPTPTVVRPALDAGRVLVTGTTEGIARARELLAQFDSAEPARGVLQVYTPQHASVGRCKTLIERVLRASEREPALEMHADEAANRLYVTAPAALHERIRRLLADEDRPVPESAQRLRIYRPKHRPVGEILDTLTHLLDDARVITNGRDDLLDVPGESPKDGRAVPTESLRPADESERSPVIPMPPPPLRAIEPTIAPASTPRRVQGSDYVLTEDEATNALIAVGTPEFHAQLTNLLAELDQRPAQVLIEMTLLAITSNNGLNLGVELEALDLGNGTDYLVFTSFGLSTVDVATGQRVLTPGIGLNGVLIRPDRIPVILRALATQGDSKVVSAPRMLVSDNTTATLRNVDEAPFTSVNASDTIATTSFGGFESAGTTLTVTPHIAQGEHLTLEYNLSFSNFTGAASDAAVPPPRTTNSFTGQVQIPDGYTIIVGGLEVENESDSVSEIPLLGRIPVVGLLFQSSTASRSKTRIYAFIRPVILRDDQFADLRYLSANALEDAEVQNKDFPADTLMWMR